MRILNAILMSLVVCASFDAAAGVITNPFGASDVHTTVKAPPTIAPVIVSNVPEAQGLPKTGTNTASNSYTSGGYHYGGYHHKSVADTKSTATATTDDTTCPCSGSNICTGPRGGKYCISDTGRKKYQHRS